VPRHTRFLLPGVPHHITQRGNHRAPVFFERGDRIAFLELLKRHSELHAIEVIAYCLMPNHVHLVLVPESASGLQSTLCALHGQYARRINRMRERTGHLWQSRYFSSAMDSNYFLNCIRYVELNPVRAGISSRAEDYEWSSAAAHCGLWRDPLVNSKERRVFTSVGNWSRWLEDGVPAKVLDEIRRNSSQNLPCGSEEFVSSLEKTVGRSLRYRPVGRDAETERDSHPEERLSPY